MPVKAVVNAFTSPEAEKRYILYLQDHAGEIDIPRLAQVMFNAGGRNAIFSMSQLADILPMINRIEGRIVQLRSLLESLTQDDAA